MKKLSTSVSTGDTFVYNGLKHAVGTQRRIDGKLMIDLKISLSATSGYTIQVSTMELNKMLKQTTN